MRKRIVINADPHETRIAILEENELVELLVERGEKRSHVGDIYKGRVNAVLPGMQAAFVEIGLTKTAFLHASDLAENLADFEDIDSEDEAPGRSGRRNRRPVPKIEDCLKKGQEILVQVTKESIGTKGPRVTQQVSLPGRFTVFMPGVDHSGVSRRIEDRGERSRLKGLVAEHRPKGAGLIVRTAGEGKGEREFGNDVKYLVKLWEKVEKRTKTSRAPSLIHRELELTTGLIRDLFTEDVEELIIDSKDAHRDILNYLRSISPELRERVKLYKGRQPILDAYDIEAQIEKAFERKVWLKKGGYLVIDQTEALVSIDVNTGRFTGKKNQEDTIFKTNIEAAREAARQLRLRDMGGIIVIDFIDMEIEANKKAVIDELRHHLKRDRSRTKAFAVSDLGLVEMTRQRERPSLLAYYSEDCSTCAGIGKILSLESVMVKLERLLRRVSAAAKEKEIVIRVAPEVAVYILEHNGRRLAEVERRYKLSIDLKDDPQVRREEIRMFSARTKQEITDQYATR
ncbi:MAG: Rne/Rng family ribonuclease [Candidatus Eisenbacteria bacterium]